MEVLKTEDDFHALAMAYFCRARDMRIVYCEVMFDVQAHTRRGVKVETIMGGLKSARREAEIALGVSALSILELRELLSGAVRTGESKLHHVSPKRSLA